MRLGNNLAGVGDDAEAVELWAANGQYRACEVLIGNKGLNSRVRIYDGENWHSAEIHDVQIVIDRMRGFVATGIRNSMTNPRPRPVKKPGATSAFGKFFARLKAVLDDATVFLQPRLGYELLASIDVVADPALTLSLEYRRGGQFFYLYLGASFGGGPRWLSIDTDHFEAFLKELTAVTRRRRLQ